ncbi:ribonuclease R [Oceaniserpentilla sp. 4NH20-0058]|uniref:ribonuclease R n=1 Tax=Oceaniserpentilla sp. 4NH20-0058 TaxID=3127660 RepID=UPI003108E38B
MKKNTEYTLYVYNHLMKKNKTSKPANTLTDPFANREAQKYDNPVASRELILETLETHPIPLTHLQLVDRLHVEGEDQIEAMRRRLIAMCRDGQLVEDRRGGFMPMSQVPLIRGRVQGHKDGYGFLIKDEGGDDLHLSMKQMRKVFDGDVVTVRLAGADNRGKQEAIIVEVQQRNTHQLVGRFYTQGDSAYVVPDARRVTQEIMIPGSEMGAAKNGQFVVVDITKQPDTRQLALGRITEVLGDHLAPGMEIDIALRSHEIPFVFPEAVETQVAAIADEVTEADKYNRIDLRDLPFVTIDGEDARDFDDAVLAQYNPKTKGWRLYVAIADVSHYVPVNSPLDVEAQNRGNSVYFPEHVVPMLPEKLSNGLCSLNPHVDRLCMVCEMSISAAGNISGYQFYEGVMHSHARLTYKLVGKILEDKDGDEGQVLREQYANIVPQLDTLYDLYKVLRGARSERGAIEFETTETRIVFNSDRKIEDIVPVTRNDAHKVIEECMLCANVATARFMEKHQQPSLYRVHQGPSEQKLENLKQYLNESGLSLTGGTKPTPKDFLQVMNQIKDRPDAHLIQSMLLRSMSQAVYQPDNEGHFGLAYPAYTHFTSPIRRYPDLLVHRAIRQLIRSESEDASLLKTVRRAEGAKPLAKKEIYPYDMAALLQFGEQCSLTERRADDATRDVMDFLKCEYMRNHLGEEFEGVISTVTNFGIFVQLSDLYIEGLVHVTNLTSDFYQFDPVRMLLRGERSGRVLRMGDTVQVVVSRVDLDDRKIDFVMQGADSNGAQGAANPSKRGNRRSGKQGETSGKRSIGTVRKRKPELKAPEGNSDSDKKDPYAKAKADKKKLMDEAKSAAKKKKPSKRQKLNNAKKNASKKTAKKKK